MKRLLIKITFILLFTFFSKPIFATQIRNLTILAEPNMVPAITKIARIYSQKNAVIVSVSFANSSDLITEIDAGEPADIFISAHRGWISNLRQKGLIDIYSINHVASDSLSLVTARNNSNISSLLLEKKLTLKESLNILDQSRSILIIDSPDSSLANYCHDLLKALNLSNIKIFEKLKEDKSSVVSLVLNSEDGYGLLTSSQAKNNKALRIIASSKDQNIFYQALVIAGDNMESAREFSKFLQSKQAKTIFRESGFIID